MAVPLQELLTTDELVTRAQGGDPAAFGKIFDGFHPMIYAFCYRTCLDAAQAQDLAQETFIKAARSLDAYRGEASFKAWLYRIAANTTKDWLRQKARRERLAEAAAETWVDETAEPDHGHVEEALNTLPEALRLAIVLTFYEGLSHAEAAAVLGCAETTVSWRVFRAKRKLKQILSRVTS